MKKIEFEWPKHDDGINQYQVQSQVIIELLKGFTRQQFMDSFVTISDLDRKKSFGCDIWFMFLGIVFSFLYENIYQMQLKKGSQEYNQIVKTIGMLASITNSDWELETDEVEMLIDKDVLPINMCAYFIDVIDEDGVHNGNFRGVKRSRFYDVMWAAGMILSEYESEYPNFKDHPEWYRDGDSNLLQLASHDLNLTYLIRKNLAEKLAKRTGPSVETMTKNHLDFEL